MDYLDALEYGEKQDPRRGKGRKGVRTNKSRQGDRGGPMWGQRRSRVRMYTKHYYPGGMLPLDIACTPSGMAEIYVTASQPQSMRIRLIKPGLKWTFW